MESDCYSKYVNVYKNIYITQAMRFFKLIVNTQSYYKDK